MGKALAIAAIAAVLASPATLAAGALQPEAVVSRVDRLAVIGLARAGDRLVAAGERGRILVSDDHGASWKVATTPTLHTLTSVFFANARTGFATGHQATLLRTEDGGTTWKEVSITVKDRPALFAVRVEGNRGIAVGAYGAYLESADGGRTWAARAIGPADFDRHLTGIAALGGNRYLVAGEAGALLATADGGVTWQALKSPYEGSFFGAIGLGNGTAIAYGMRGNAFRTTDAGRTWTRIDLGAYKGALQGASDLGDRIVLNGADGMIAESRDGGLTFTVKPLQSRALVAALLRDALGRLLMAGPGGLRRID
jgi:photosystem II stability/assembly factor-like uncharacterized protein